MPERTYTLHNVFKTQAYYNYNDEKYIDYTISNISYTRPGIYLNNTCLYQFGENLNNDGGGNYSYWIGYKDNPMNQINIYFLCCSKKSPFQNSLFKINMQSETISSLQIPTSINSTSRVYYSEFCDKGIIRGNSGYVVFNFETETGTSIPNFSINSDGNTNQLKDLFHISANEVSDKIYKFNYSTFTFSEYLILDIKASVALAISSDLDNTLLQVMEYQMGLPGNMYYSEYQSLKAPIPLLPTGTANLNIEVDNGGTIVPANTDFTPSRNGVNSTSATSFSGTFKCPVEVTLS